MFRRKQQATASEKNFWDWFLSRSDEYFFFEENHEPLFDALAEALSKVHPDLCFEFGPVENGKRDFVISADGIKDSFPAVTKLYRAAPELPQWRLIAFRPRRDPRLNLKFADFNVEAEGLWFELTPHGKKVGVTLFLPDLKADKNTILQIVYLMLDNALGEFDVETKLGFIEHEILPAEPKTKGLKPFVEIPHAVDEMFERLN